MFVGADGQPVLLLNLERSVEAPATKVVGLPPALDRVVLRALDRSPARRFATAQEMAAAIEAAVQPATHAQVAAWMIGIARPSLEAKAELVRRVEAVEDLPPLVATGERPRITGDEPTDVDDAPTLDQEGALQVIAADTTLAAEPAAPPAPHAKSGAQRLWLWASATALLGLGLSAVWALREHRSVSPAELFFQGDLGAPLLTASVAASAPSTGEEPPAAPSATAALSASAGARATPIPARNPGRTTGGAAPADCDPPFTLDSQGHKRYKKHCFK